MCGRFTLSVTAETIWELFELAGGPPMGPRYNIAPSQPVAAVRCNGEAGGRELVFLRWGLLPHWAKDPAMGARMINARGETVAEKPSFRTAFRRGRCLIPADGWYEWKREGEGKQPYHIRMAGGALFAFAGLWEHWKGGEGGPIESCTIITSACNDALRPVHERMPVIVAPENFAAWLDPAVEGGERMQALLTPHAGAALAFHPVSTHVNRPANDDPSCVEALA